MMMKTPTVAKSAELRSSRRGRGDLAPASLGAADLEGPLAHTPPRRISYPALRRCAHTPAVLVGVGSTALLPNPHVSRAGCYLHEPHHVALS